MEKLREIVVLSSPFEHSIELSASHRTFSRIPSGKISRRGGHTTIKSGRAQTKITLEFEKKFKKVIDDIAKNPEAHLVMRNVEDSQLIRYAKEKIEEDRISEVDDLQYSPNLKERITKLSKKDVANLKVIGMGEYASFCVTGGVLETLSHIYNHRKVAVPLENAHVDLEHSFLHDDFIDSNLKHLTLPELESRITDEMDGFTDSVLEMGRLGEIRLPKNQINWMAIEPHRILPKEQYDAIRKRHRKLRMDELRKMAKKQGWTEEDFAHEDSGKILRGILSGTFREEKKAHMLSPMKLNEDNVGEMETISAKDAAVRKRLRNVSRRYMREQLKKRVPTA